MMHHQSQTNPFLQHALRHGRRFLEGSDRVVGLAQAQAVSCDEIISAINSGNMQGAMNSAQNARNVASELNYITQELNGIINERMQMASYMVGRIQYRINELSRALETMRGEQGYAAQGFQSEFGQFNPNPYHCHSTSPVM